MIDLDRPAPPARASSGDWFAPAVIAGSLVVHAAVLAALFWSPKAEAARPPVETPVEVVQQMPPEPAKPPPKAVEKPKTPAPKPLASKQAKAEQAKAESKPPAKPASQTLASQKTAAQKPPASPKMAAKQPPAPPAKPRETKPQEAKRQDAKPQDAKPQDAKPQDAVRKALASQEDVAERMQKLIGPMPAYALPALATGDNALDDGVSYKQIVLGRVAAQKREGRHEGVPGHVIVAFAIGDHGEVLNCEIREKSADPNLDAEAIAMVQRAAPYPPPPPGAPREFTFGLRFQIL